MEYPPGEVTADPDARRGNDADAGVVTSSGEGGDTPGVGAMTTCTFWSSSSQMPRTRR